MNPTGSWRFVSCDCCVLRGILYLKLPPDDSVLNQEHPFYTFISCLSYYYSLPYNLCLSRHQCLSKLCGQNLAQTFDQCNECYRPVFLYLLSNTDIPRHENLQIYRGADKSLARPGRKQATATKLYCKPLIQKNQKVVRPTRSPQQQ